MEEREYDPERNETENEFSEEQWDVNYTGFGDDVSSGLDWGEIENYGTDSEVGKFFRNNEDAQGYGDLQTATDVGVFKIFAKEQIARGRNGEKTRSSRQFNKKLTNNPKDKYKFRKMQTDAGITGGNREPFEEKQARLAKVEGLELSCDFEQMISGWGKAGNKASCFECGRADHFKAECPIWIKKKEKWQQEGKTGKGKNERGGEMLLCLHV